MYVCASDHELKSERVHEVYLDHFSAQYGLSHESLAPYTQTYTHFATFISFVVLQCPFSSSEPKRECYFRFFSPSIAFKYVRKGDKKTNRL